MGTSVVFTLGCRWSLGGNVGCTWAVAVAKSRVARAPSSIVDREESSIAATRWASAFCPCEISDSIANKVLLWSCVAGSVECGGSHGLLALVWRSVVGCRVGNKKDSPMCSLFFVALVDTFVNLPVDEALVDFFAFLAVGVVLGGITNTQVLECY